LQDADCDDFALRSRWHGDSTISGTRIGRALREAVELFDERFPGHHDVLLVSDGDDPARDDEWRDGVIVARQRGVRMDTLGIGDPEHDSPIPTNGHGEFTYEGVPVTTHMHETPLKLIARDTGGAYIAARTAPIALSEIYQKILEPRPTREHVDDVLPARRDRYQWFFAAALVCLGTAISLHKRRSRNSGSARSDVDLAGKEAA
jgi:hypothetical protein